MNDRIDTILQCANHLSFYTQRNPRKSREYVLSPIKLKWFDSFLFLRIIRRYLHNFHGFMINNNENCDLFDNNCTISESNSIFNIFSRHTRFSTQIIIWRPLTFDKSKFKKKMISDRIKLFDGRDEATHASSIILLSDGHWHLMNQN